MVKKIVILLIFILIFSILLSINKFEQNTYSKLDTITLSNKKDIENYFFKFLTKNSLDMMEYSNSPSLENTLINWRIMNKFGLIDDKDINHDVVKGMVVEKIKSVRDKSDDMFLYKKYDYLYYYKVCFDELGIENNDFIMGLMGDTKRDVDLILNYINNNPQKLVMYLDILNKIISINGNENIKANITEKINDIEDIDYQNYPEPEQLMIKFNLLELCSKIGIEKEDLRTQARKELLNIVDKYQINGNIDINNIVILNKGLKIFSHEFQGNEKLERIVEEMKAMLLSKNDFQVFVKIQVYELVDKVGLWDESLKEWVLNMPKNKENIYPSPVDLIPTFRNLYLFLRITELNNMNVTGLERNIENYLQIIINTYKSKIINKRELYYAFKIQEYINNKELEEIAINSMNKYINDMSEIEITEENLFENYMFFNTISEKEYRDKLKDNFDEFFNNEAIKFNGTKEELFLKIMNLDIKSYYSEKDVEKQIHQLDDMVANYNGELELMILEMYLKINNNLGLKISKQMENTIENKLSKYRTKNGYFENPQFKSISIAATHRGLEIEKLLLELNGSENGD